MPKAKEATQQQLTKPGPKANMQIKPKFLAPAYLGSDKLKGTVSLTTGEALTSMVYV